MNARQTREALLEAVNAHKIDAIKSFVDPSYVARNEAGTVGRPQSCFKAPTAYILDRGIERRLARGNA